jgi:hypothetical protein
VTIHELQREVENLNQQPLAVGTGVAMVAEMVAEMGAGMVEAHQL